MRAMDKRDMGCKEVWVFIVVAARQGCRLIGFKTQPFVRLVLATDAERAGSLAFDLKGTPSVGPAIKNLAGACS